MAGNCSQCQSRLATVLGTPGVPAAIAVVALHKIRGKRGGGAIGFHAWRKVAWAGLPTGQGYAGGPSDSPSLKITQPTWTPYITGEKPTIAASVVIASGSRRNPLISDATVIKDTPASERS